MNVLSKKSRGKRIKLLNNQRQGFLRTFFNGEKYDFKEVNGYVLEQRLNGDTNKWEVAIYTKESWRARNAYKEKSTQREFLKGIWNE